MTMKKYITYCIIEAENEEHYEWKIEHLSPLLHHKTLRQFLKDKK